MQWKYVKGVHTYFNKENTERAISAGKDVQHHYHERDADSEHSEISLHAYFNI